MQYRNIIRALLAVLAINVILWACFIVVGLLGCTGNLSVVQCAFAWTALTAGALIAKIVIGINLLEPEKEKAACGNRRREVRKEGF